MRWGEENRWDEKMIGDEAHRRDGKKRRGEMG